MTSQDIKELFKDYGLHIDTSKCNKNTFDGFCAEVIRTVNEENAELIKLCDDREAKVNNMIEKYHKDSLVCKGKDFMNIGDRLKSNREYEFIIIERG